MDDQPNYVSFMVRLWRDPAETEAGAPRPLLVGELESVQTGRSWQFRGLDGLLDLLTQAANGERLKE